MGQQYSETWEQFEDYLAGRRKRAAEAHKRREAEKAERERMAVIAKKLKEEKEGV